MEGIHYWALVFVCRAFGANEAVILGLDGSGVNMLGIYMRMYSCSDLYPQIMGDLALLQVQVEVA